MSLDHANGEKLGAITEQYRIAPVNKYRGQQVFDEAVKHAKAALLKAGALIPVHIPDRDILIQEYPVSGLCIMIFERVIAGREHYTTATFNLNGEGKPVEKSGIKFN